MKKFVSVHLDEELKAQLKQLADQNSRTLHNMIVHLIKKAVKSELEETK